MVCVVHVDGKLDSDSRLRKKKQEGEDFILNKVYLKFLSYLKSPARVSSRLSKKKKKRRLGKQLHKRA